MTSTYEKCSALHVFLNYAKQCMINFSKLLFIFFVIIKRMQIFLTFITINQVANYMPVWLCLTAPYCVPGKTPHLYRHDLMMLHSRQTNRFSLPMKTKIPEKLVPR